MCFFDVESKGGNGPQNFETMATFFHQKLSFHVWDCFSSVILSLSTRLYHQRYPHDVYSPEKEATLTKNVYQPDLFTQNI